MWDFRVRGAEQREPCVRGSRCRGARRAGEVFRVSVRAAGEVVCLSGVPGGVMPVLRVPDFALHRFPPRGPSAAVTGTAIPSNDVRVRAQSRLTDGRGPAGTPWAHTRPSVLPPGPHGQGRPGGAPCADAHGVRVVQPPRDMVWGGVPGHLGVPGWGEEIPGSGGKRRGPSPAYARGAPHAADHRGPDR